MRWRLAVLASIGVYLSWGALLIAQRPGLYDDEAMMAAGAVHVLESRGSEFNLPHAPHTWICKFHLCLPLMAESRYIGAEKDYLCLPLFALFGSRVAIIRVVSLMLGAAGIAGLAMLVARQAGAGPAAAVAFALALNPSYANAIIFDNGAVAGMTAAFGLLCAALSRYLKRPTAGAAFWIGLAAGLGIWARANFLWILIAGAAAALLVYGYRHLPPASHGLWIAAGGILGGLPFLVYQVVSRGGTWEALNLFTAAQPFRQLIRYRLFLFADTLLSDGEHRRMWNAAGSMPQWQLWLFPAVAVAACIACVTMSWRESGKRGAFARFAALACVFLAALMLFSRLEVAEHHIIAILPLAATAVILAGSLLQARLRPAWVLSAILALVYAGSGVYWNVAAVRGLHRSGGVGLWSDAGVDLARLLDREYPGREVKTLDWGFSNSLFVRTGGRIHSKDLFWGGTDQLSGTGRPWLEEIREGGVFLAGGPEVVETPASSPAFLNALAGARPTLKRRTIAQRNGLTYAQIIEIEPGTVRGPAPAGAPVYELTGVYPPESSGWRWTGPRFSVRLQADDTAAGRPWLVMRVFIPDANIRALGPVTLSARIGAHALASETYGRPGQYAFTRELDEAWLDQASGWIGFTLDKWIPPGPADPRELGIVLLDVSIRAR